MIDMAEGDLVASLGCNQERAFQLLVARSQRENRKLRGLSTTGRPREPSSRRTRAARETPQRMNDAGETTFKVTPKAGTVTASEGTVGSDVGETNSFVVTLAEVGPAPLVSITGDLDLPDVDQVSAALVTAGLAATERLRLDLSVLAFLLQLRAAGADPGAERPGDPRPGHSHRGGIATGASSVGNDVDGGLLPASESVDAAPWVPCPHDMTIRTGADTFDDIPAQAPLPSWRAQGVPRLNPLCPGTPGWPAATGVSTAAAPCRLTVGRGRMRRRTRGPDDGRAVGRPRRTRRDRAVRRPARP